MSLNLLEVSVVRLTFFGRNIQVYHTLNNYIVRVPLFRHHYLLFGRLWPPILTSSHTDSPPSSSFKNPTPLTRHRTNTTTNVLRYGHNLKYFTCDFSSQNDILKKNFFLIRLKKRRRRRLTGRKKPTRGNHGTWGSTLGGSEFGGTTSLMDISDECLSMAESLRWISLRRVDKVKGTPGPKGRVPTGALTRSEVY